MDFFLDRYKGIKYGTCVSCVTLFFSILCHRTFSNKFYKFVLSSKRTLRELKRFVFSRRIYFQGDVHNKFCKYFTNFFVESWIKNNYRLTKTENLILS